MDTLRRELGADDQSLIDRLVLYEADLCRDDGWIEAASGCRYVLHVASPVPAAPPEHPDDVIRPAREGTLRVLRAARTAGVERVVLTSSISAVLYGHARDGTRTYDERDWSQLSPEVGPYEQSKTLAERAAWELVQSWPHERGLELVTLLPGVVLGPVMSSDYAVSVEIVRKLIAREVPGCPDLGWALVDVRDLAAAQLAALNAHEAAGKRFILASEHVAMLDIARILARRLAVRGFDITTRRVPDWLLRLLARIDRTVALTVPELGKRQDVSSAQARAILQWSPRSTENTLADTAESLIAHGIVRVPRARAWQRVARRVVLS